MKLAVVNFLYLTLLQFDHSSFLDRTKLWFYKKTVTPLRIFIDSNVSDKVSEQVIYR